MVKLDAIPTLGRPKPRAASRAAKPGLVSPPASHFIPWKLVKWTRYGRWTEDGSDVISNSGSTIYTDSKVARERRRIALEAELIRPRQIASTQASTHAVRKAG